MKNIKTLIYGSLILITANGVAQPMDANLKVSEPYQIIALQPLDLFNDPETLKHSWIRNPMPLEFYSLREKEAQKEINDKTTDKIITYSPLNKDAEWLDIDYEEITPFTWKWVDFELIKPDGTISKINLRRPNWWIMEIKADHPGSKVYLDMPELSAQGWATVTAIRTNQLDTRLWDAQQTGDYVTRPITGKFEHASSDVYELQFENNTAPTGVTGSHPFWSVDRNDWMSASHLHIGETVKTYDGNLKLSSRTKKTGIHKVYNIEVYKDHNYLVSINKILVHNNSFHINGRKVADVVGDATVTLEGKTYTVLPNTPTVKALKVESHAQKMAPGGGWDWNNMIDPLDPAGKRLDKMVFHRYNDGVMVIQEGHTRFVGSRLSGTNIPFDNPNAVEIIDVPGSSAGAGTTWDQVKFYYYKFQNKP